ncbi:MAG: hypothetical protein C4518_07345 [Desulfobacteraceae bacterium]|nr:MAG: hypothetical protein C4518_07345 [Desulfobacteraceae bacterium]
MGGLLLAGGAEFQGRMTEPDRQAIALTGKKEVTVCIIPTAAAPDNNHEHAGNNGVRWFQSLGVKNVQSLPIIDAASANDRQLAESLANADLIYLLGGFPGYLEKTMRESACWAAILDAYHRGAILAGSSAGAMVLCEWFLNPENRQLQPGLNLLPHMIVIPHHEKTGKQWTETIQNQLPDAAIVGIDEETGIIRKQGSDQWNVHGKGSATVYRKNRKDTYAPGLDGFRM